MAEDTPQPGALEHDDGDTREELQLRDRHEIVDGLQKQREEGEHTVNQTTDQGNPNQVEGFEQKAPEIKRGQKIYTDEDGNYHKELLDAPVNPEPASDQEPAYLQFHQEVLEGRDPFEAQKDWADRETARYDEARDPDGESAIRTGTR